MRGCIASIALAAGLACASTPRPRSAPAPAGADRAPRAPLTGNWAVDASNGDGAVRRSYFDLVQRGTRITGSIRTTQFYYPVVEGGGGADSFSITGTMQDGRTPRRVTYEGKLIGDELHLFTRRRPELPLTETIAHRVPEGEGAMPARVALPARRVVPENGLARTRPCARWPTRWPRTGCARPATST
jgi:alpha-galactosidase